MKNIHNALIFSQIRIYKKIYPSSPNFKQRTVLSEVFKPPEDMLEHITLTYKNKYLHLHKVPKNF